MVDVSDIRPLDVDGVGAATVGTALFALALLGCLLARDTLAANGSSWWIWVCVTGVGTGMIGIAYSTRRRAAYRAARRDQE